MRRFKAKKKGSSGTLHIEQESADKLFIDYTDKKVSFIDQPTGEVIEVGSLSGDSGI